MSTEDVRDKGCCVLVAGVVVEVVVATVAVAADVGTVAIFPTISVRIRPLWLEFFSPVMIKDIKAICIYLILAIFYKNEPDTDEHDDDDDKVILNTINTNFLGLQ